MSNKIKAEGAEFLRRLGILVMAFGGLASVGVGLIGVSSGEFDLIAYGVAGIALSAVLFGVCTNIASINTNINRIYLMKFKEFNKGNEDNS